MSVQFYGYNFGGTGVFHFIRFYAFFLKKIVSDLGDFQTLCVIRDSHRESTTCKLVCEINRGINSKSGSSFMGLAVSAGISIWNEECSELSSLEMLSLTLTASPIKDVPDLQ